MTHLALCVLFGLVGKDNDLFGLAVLNDLCADTCTVYERCADLDRLAVCRNSNDFADCDFVFCLNVKLFNKNLVSD